jgi:hypothetical protein
MRVVLGAAAVAAVLVATAGAVAVTAAPSAGRCRP